MVETADGRAVVRIQTVGMCVRGSVLVYIFSQLWPLLKLVSAIDLELRTLKSCT